MSIIPYMPGAEPFFHRGGPVGCLVVHGFTATPAEVRWLAADLAERGYTVWSPRLPGHGTQPSDLRRVRWQDWLAALLDAYRLLDGLCERVCLVGHSMGGVLALLLATEVPVSCVAVLASPMQLSAGARATRWLRHVVPYMRMADLSSFPAFLREEQARRGEPARGRIRYDMWATAGIAQLNDLVNVTHQRLPHVSAPLLLVYSHADEAAPPANAILIAGRVASAVIEQHVLSVSAHILPQDREHARVFELVADFVARHG